jgi:hypothetical protein
MSNHVRAVLALLCGLLLAAGAGCGGPEGELPGTSIASSRHALVLPQRTIRLQVVAAADNDGTGGTDVTKTHLTNRLAQLNSIFASTNITFVYDENADYKQVDMTLINQDVTLFEDPATCTDPNVRPASSGEWNNVFRRAIADASRGKLTLIFTRAKKLAYDAQLGHWTMVHQTFGSSGGQARYVMFRTNSPGAVSMAHEIGHYLHQVHPFVEGVPDVATAAARIKAYVEAGHPTWTGLDALDGDRAYVLDTPADAAGSIFEEIYGEGNKCGPGDTITIPVTFGSGASQTYYLQPDRSLVMSYFKGCFPDDHFSPQQALRIHEGIDSLNRRDLVSVKPSSLGIKLVKKGTAGAGAVSAVGVARVGHRRVVTGTLGSGTLKLIVWDVSASGLTITRRGSAVVGAASQFALTHAGLSQVAVARRDGAGNLQLATYAVDDAGNLALRGTASAGGITDLAIARLGRLDLVTPVRMADAAGTLRVIAWRVYADGSITRTVHADGTAISDLEAARYTATVYGTSTTGGLVLHLRDTAGNLRVQSWQLSTKPWALAKIDDEAAGGTLSFAAATLDFDLSATVVRAQSGAQKVISWKTTYNGAVTRKASSSETGYCIRQAAAPVGVEMLATACRDKFTNALQLRLFEVEPHGAAVTLRHTVAPGDVIQDVAMTPVGDDMVLTAARMSNNGLKLTAWKQLNTMLVSPPPFQL